MKREVYGVAKGYDRGDASVMCPYYVGCIDRSIICEGGLDCDGKTETRFSSNEKKREYMFLYCRSCYYACSICVKNDEKYGFVRRKTGKG